MDTIHRHAYRVTDRMVAGLAQAGTGEDDVFEISVASAFGAARRVSTPGSAPCARLGEGTDAARGGRPRPGLRRQGEVRDDPAVSGAPTLDVVKTLSFRPSFFGTPFNELMQEVMRGPSEWTVGERELFAAFVSERNRCEF